MINLDLRSISQKLKGRRVVIVQLQGEHSEKLPEKNNNKTFSFRDCWLFSFFILCVFFFCRVCFPTLFDRCCCAAAQTSTFHHHLSPRALLSAHVHLMGRHSVRWWDEEPTKSIEKHSLELSSFCRPELLRCDEKKNQWKFFHMLYAAVLLVVVVGFIRTF